MQSRFTEDDKGKAGYSLLKFTKSTTFLHDLHSAFTITGNLHCWSVLEMNWAEWVEQPRLLAWNSERCRKIWLYSYRCNSQDGWWDTLMVCQFNFVYWPTGIVTLWTPCNYISFIGNLFWMPFCSSDTDECTEGLHGCHSNATCQNTKGSHNCTCKPGFIGDGANCKLEGEWLLFLWSV